MQGTNVVVGVFTYIDDAIDAIKGAKAAQLDYQVYSPFFSHELDSYATEGRSPVRMFSSVGACLGLTFGFAMTILCSLDWPIRVSAKDIVSVPAYIPVGYECTILFGALFTLASMFHFSRLPDIIRKVGFDPRFSQDKFGVVIGCDRAQIDEVKKKLLESGAEEVDVRDGI